VKLATTILVLIAATAAAETQPPSSLKEPITFRFHPVSVGQKRAFHVEVRFRVARAVTPIVVPTSWGDASHLEGQTQNLKILTSGATLVAGAKLGLKELHARPGQQVALAYDIVPLQTEWFRHPQEHMAIINDDYFLFNPENALVYPELPRTEIVNATFDWRALPKGTPLVTSFGVGQRLLRVRCTDATGDWLVRIGQDAVTSAAPGAEAADCEVSGGASDLYRSLWNRPPARSLCVAGDRALIGQFGAQVRIRWS